MKRSFFLIKPDAVLFGHIEKIINFLKMSEFKIVARKRVILRRENIMFLYPMHVFQGFFEDLVAFMISGPSELFIVEKDSAVEDLDWLVGETDPKENKGNTLRGQFGTDIRHNAVHSSNGQENAVREILYFFPEFINQVY